jgi:hypothetical protein
MLHVPFGALFDAMGVGQNVGRDEVALHWQSAYHKRHMGGVLGRVSRRTSQATHADRFLMDLVAAQEGAPASALIQDPRAVSEYFSRFAIRYVLVSQDKIAPNTKKALSHWPMHQIDAEPPYVLYEANIERPRLKS